MPACTLKPASDHAEQIHSAYVITFIFAAVIFAVVGGLIVFSAIRFRRKDGDDTLPAQTHGNTKIEIVWTVIPSIIVLVLFIVSSTTLGKLDSAEASPMTINVTGFQWEWKFVYPEFNQGGTVLTVQGKSGNPPTKPTLWLPVNQPIHFHLESPDVIHSFFIPEFLFKRDVIPGHPNDFTLTPNRTGRFDGKCAELCGLLHSEMLFVVRIVPQDQFRAWANDTLQFQVKHASQCTQPQGGTITVHAKNISFDTQCIQVPASGTTKIAFDNQDAGIPHNIEIYTNSSAAQRLAGASGPSDVITGPMSTTYSISGLSAGTYFFKCDVHPQMNGQFKVTG